MPSLCRSTVFTGYLSQTAGEIAVGDCLVLNAAGDAFILSTSANRAASGRLSAGIALTAGDGENNRAVEIQFCGLVPESITELGDGAVDYVRVSDAGRLERGTSGDVVGACDLDGVAYVMFGGILGIPVSGQAPFDVGTAPYPDASLAGSFAAVGFNWGLPSDFTTGYLIRANYPSLYDDGEIGYPVISASDAGNGDATLTFGSSSANVGEQIVTSLSGDAVNLIVNGNAALKIVSTDVTTGMRWGAYFNSTGYRVAIGADGSSSYPEFSSTNNAAGPMLMITEAIAEPTGLPTGSSRDAVRIWLSNPSTGGLKIQFPSGNIAIIPDVDGVIGGAETVALGTDL